MSEPSSFAGDWSSPHKIGATQPEEHQMKHLRRSFLPLCLLTLSTIAAHADTVSTFDISGNSAPIGVFGAGPLSGTLTIDTTTGVVTGSDIILNVPDVFSSSSDEIFVFNTAPVSQGEVVPNIFVIELKDGSTESFGLALPISSLVDYTGGPICSETNPCTSDSSSSVSPFLGTYFSNPESASLTLENPITTNPSTVPEPSSLALMGTGVVGAFCTLRRRFLN
jgi:PEP-CTERM motif